MRRQCFPRSPPSSSKATGQLQPLGRSHHFRNHSDCGVDIDSVCHHQRHPRPWRPSLARLHKTSDRVLGEYELWTPSAEEPGARSVFWQNLSSYPARAGEVSSFRLYDECRDVQIVRSMLNLHEVKIPKRHPVPGAGQRAASHRK